MGYDWAVVALLAAIGVSCVQIYATYRRQMMLIKPVVDQLESSRSKIEIQIQEHDSYTEEIKANIAGLEKELVALNQTREDLQERLLEREMILIPAGEFIMGDD